MHSWGTRARVARVGAGHPSTCLVHPCACRRGEDAAEVPLQCLVRLGSSKPMLHVIHVHRGCSSCSCRAQSLSSLSPLCPGRGMLHSSRIMSWMNNPVSRLAWPEPASHESAGAWPAACLSPGSCRLQEPGEEPVSLSPSRTHPLSLSPAASRPNRPPGHTGAWQRRGGSVHCGCPLRPGWRRKQGFPGSDQVLPVSSQQLSALGLRAGCS